MAPWLPPTKKSGHRNVSKAGTDGMAGRARLKDTERTGPALMCSNQAIKRSMGSKNRTWPSSPPVMMKFEIVDSHVRLELCSLISFVALRSVCLVPISADIP